MKFDKILIILTLTLTIAFIVDKSSNKYSKIGACFVQADLNYQNVWGKECLKEGKSIDCEDIKRGFELSTKLIKNEAVCMKLYK